MRRLAIFVAIALAVVGIAFALIPYSFSESSPPGTPGALFIVSTDCGAPVVSAFGSRQDYGWVGTGPMTPAAFADFPTCKSAGQRRLTYGGMFLLAAAVIAVALRREGSNV